MTFEINVVFDAGRKFFFKSGRMRAVLSDLGIIDSRNYIINTQNNRNVSILECSFGFV